MVLPRDIRAASSPEVKCEFNFKSSAGLQIGIFGMNFTGVKDDIYSVKVTLISEQSIAPVSEDGGVMPWFAPSYRRQFQYISGAIGANKSLFLVDKTAIYLLEVNVFRKTGGGFAGIFGGGYTKETSLSKSKLLVSGGLVSIDTDMHLAGGALGPQTLDSIATSPDSSALSPPPLPAIGLNPSVELANKKALIDPAKIDVEGLTKVPFLSLPASGF